ncbi:26S proteasome non-ATPase regulatory subunit 8 [Chamberlinius hualienensis]
MSNLKSAMTDYQLLYKEWTQKNCNLDKCGKLLSKLKVDLTQLLFLPTTGEGVSPQELLLARDILEIGAQWSIKVKDIPSFERYMAQLKYYYMDYKESNESPYKFQLLGLNLLCLLAKNKVADFHTELELLPPSEINNVYIRHPVSLEQYLMEGSYNKIFLAKDNVPCESYQFFINILLDTIRHDIAGCVEKAYEKIAVTDAQRMLFFNDRASIQKLGEKKGWQLESDGCFHFDMEDKTDDSIPSLQLASQAVEYAMELEMIV